MINIHWMDRCELMRLLYEDKLFAKSLFQSRESDNEGLQAITSVGDLVLGVKNKNLWVKNIKEI